MKDLALRLICVGDTRAIQVVAQTYRGSKFSVTGASWVASNGFTLLSSGAPEIVVGGMYVLGSSRGCDDVLLPISPEYGEGWIGQLSFAVKEYNNSRSLVISNKEQQLTDVPITSRIIS